MAFTNFGDLKTEIANWLHRSDLTSQIPSFVTLAESEMKARLRPVDLEARTTFTVDSEYETVPSGVESIRRLKLTSNDKPLDYFAPDLFQRTRASEQTGTPTAFTRIGTEFQFAPAPDTTYTAEIAYQGTLTALSDDSDTNYVLTNHPQAYLFGALAMAADYLKKTDDIVKYEALFEKALEKIKQQSASRRNVGTLRMRAMDVV